MVHHKPPFQIPRDELLFIEPEPREKLFYNMLQNYQVYCPGIKLLYAYLNWDSKKFPMIDYMVVFSAKSLDGTNIILWKIPYIYTFDSIPGYRYAVRNNLYQKWYKEQTDTICRISFVKFKEFLREICHLDIKPGEACWTNAEHTDILVDNMSELSLQYTPKS